ncbi:MAG TPA: Maf family protein [Rugosibacter sp.]
MPDNRIYLVSRSVRRRELLNQAGIRFELLLFRSGERQDAEVDESCLAGETPEVYVHRVARAKAIFGTNLLLQRHLPKRLLLAADTTIDLDGEVIGKPKNSADAIAILRRLSGRSHRVLTAVVAALPHDVEPRVKSCLSVSEVTFRTLTEDEILRYVQIGESLDKAGAYGIQGRAATFVESIRGSYTGIVGLPLCETVLMLREFGQAV